MNKEGNQEGLSYGNFTIFPSLCKLLLGCFKKKKDYRDGTTLNEKAFSPNS